MYLSLNNFERGLTVWSCQERKAKELWDKLDDAKKSQVLAIFEDMKERGQSATADALLAVFARHSEVCWVIICPLINLDVLLTGRLDANRG